MVLNPKRVLLVSTTTGYQTRSFVEAAERLGVELVLATDRCHQLDDPWRDAAIPVRFYDEEDSLHAVIEASSKRSVQGVIPLGDRPTVLAARIAASLGLPGNPVAAAEISRSKLATRERLTSAGLVTPWFRRVALDVDPSGLALELSYPCVVKPLGLAGSRGVIRADNPTEFVMAFERLRRLLSEPSIMATRDALNETLLVEGFVRGREVALEGLVEDGHLRTLAIFDKPDPLDGPFFEETIYVTPSALPSIRQRELESVVARAIAAIGLHHGPVHAECRIQEDIVVLEVAARPIGGLCARALRFEAPGEDGVSLEELLLRHACRQETRHLMREAVSSGVMMIPIPARGIYRRVEGVDVARGVPGVEDVQITAKPDQLLVPLPEGASYLGFIFARCEGPEEVVRVLRTAHDRLAFVIDREIAVRPHLTSVVSS
jgi:biotin carboxylase